MGKLEYEEAGTMTSEEMQRAIEFLLEHQATLEQRIEQTNAQIAETSRQLAAYAETQSEFLEIATRSIQTLAQAQTRTDERQTRMDERLNALLSIVERHVMDEHGGQA